MPEPGFTGYCEWEGRPGSGMGAITADETESIFDATPGNLVGGSVPNWTIGKTFDEQRAIQKEIDNQAKWDALSIQSKINKLERQKQKAIAGGIFPWDNYSLSGNIQNLGRLHAQRLAREYMDKYGEEHFDQYGGWGSFNDLMAHGYLGSRGGLPMAQLLEAATGGSQPSDYINNVLASRFFRGDSTSTSPSLLGGIPGILASAFKEANPNAARINNILSKAGIQPMSASARWSHPMDAWAKLVHAEMSNPGSTGWNFKTDTEDTGVHLGGYLWDAIRGREGAKLW